eukprot:gene19748-30436_t
MSGGTRMFAGLAERMRESPTGSLLRELHLQQASIEKEMKVLQVELDRALAPELTPAARHPSLHSRTFSPPTPATSPPMFGLDGRLISPQRLRTTPPFLQQSAFEQNDAVFDHPHTNRRSSLARHQSDQSVFVDDSRVHPSEEQLRRRKSLADESEFSDGYPSYFRDDDTPLIPQPEYEPSWVSKVQSELEGRWNRSTAVEGEAERRQRPEPLYAGPRPKSREWFHMKEGEGRGSPGRRHSLNRRISAPATRARSRSLGASSLRSAATRQRSSSVLHARRMSGAQRGSRVSVRDTSPDFDLVSRPQKFFDSALMNAPSVMNAGTVQATDTTAYRGVHGTPLRGELSPSATKSGLWMTLPHSAKHVRKELSFFTR